MATRLRQRDVPRVPDGGEDKVRLYRAIENLARRSEELQQRVDAFAAPTGYGLYSARPAAGVEGRLYFASNSRLVYRDTGAAWESFHPATMQKVTPSFPVLAGFTQLNFAVNVSASQAGDDGYRHDPAAAGLALRGLYKTAPTRPYTITVSVLENAFHPTSGFGLMWRQNDGKMAMLLCQHETTGYQIYSAKFNSETSFSASYGNFEHFPGMPRFLRIKEDNTNREVYFSNNGIDFHLYHQVGRTDFITATQVGIVWNSQTAALNAGWNWLSWAADGGL